jgi:hypothetical protein
MMVGMRRTIIWVAGIAALAMTPVSALAEEVKVYDGRLEVFPRNLTLDSGSTGLIWMLLFGLAVLGLGVLFFAAHRSHLD